MTPDPRAGVFKPSLQLFFFPGSYPNFSTNFETKHLLVITGETDGSTGAAFGAPSLSTRLPSMPGRMFREVTALVQAWTKERHDNSNRASSPTFPVTASPHLRSHDHPENTAELPWDHVTSGAVRSAEE